MKNYRIKEQELEAHIDDVQALRNVYGVEVEEIKPEVKKLFAYCFCDQVTFYKYELEIDSAMQKRTPQYDITFEEK